MPSGNEPLITWNLILCGVAFPALAFYVKSLLRFKEDRDDEKLIDKEKRDDERHMYLKEEMARMRKCIGNIKQDLDEKRDIDDCEERGKEKWDRINHHFHDKDGRVVLP